jgi:hypothetical protein
MSADPREQLSLQLQEVGIRAAAEWLDAMLSKQQHSHITVDRLIALFINEDIILSSRGNLPPGIHVRVHSRIIHSQLEY